MASAPEASPDGEKQTQQQKQDQGQQTSQPAIRIADRSFHHARLSESEAPQSPQSTTSPTKAGGKPGFPHGAGAGGHHRPHNHPTAALAAELAGGIYHTRTIDRQRSLSQSTPRRRQQRPSLAHDGEDGAGSVTDWRHDDDGRTKQVFRGRTLLWLAYQSIGAIYGDIGTSPLYVFSSTFSSPPSPDQLVQVLSLVVWSITLVVTVKYVVIILLADNEGEGGTFSCYSLLTRYANIAKRDPRDQATGGVHFRRHLTSELGPGTQRLRSALEQSLFVRGLLKTIGVLAVSMVISDGVLTPAQSILGAVQGLSVVKPDISQPVIVGTTCGIIVLLFLIQPLGTAVLASSFAPIVIVWLSFNGGFGIYNLVKWDWTVLRAFSPYFAFRFFIENQTEGWRMLGGVLLAFTGVEALFADLGAFSLGAIRLSWLCYTYPCLLLAYVGQAAFISAHPDAVANPFFNSVPPGMLYPSLVAAVLAAVVASQAMITATFQLVSQIMKLSYSPQIKVVHTSRVFHGQLFVPFLNWVLMVGAIVVTAAFRDTTSLGHAYGVCVMFVTFFDTCMVTLVALIVWRLHWALVIVPALAFASIDGLYLSSALTKVPEGAWITLLSSGVLTSIFLLWRYGKEKQWAAEAADRFQPGALVTVTPTNTPPPGQQRHHELRLAGKWGGDSISTIRGFAVFFDKAGSMTPSVFAQFVTKFVAMPEVCVFFHLHPVERPTVEDSDRYVVSRVREIPGCYRLVVRHGYMDEVISPDLAALIYQQVRAFVASRAGPPLDSPDGTAAAAAAAWSPPAAASSAISPHTCPLIPAADPPDVAEHVRTFSADGFSSPSQNQQEEPEDGGVADEDRLSPRITGSLRKRQTRDSGVSPHSQVRRPGGLGVPDLLSDAAEELDSLDRAFASRVTYIVGKEQMQVRAGTGWARTTALETFLWIRDNTRGKIANLRLATDRVVEVGFIKEI